MRFREADDLELLVLAEPGEEEIDDEIDDKAQAIADEHADQQARKCRRRPALFGAGKDVDADEEDARSPG